MFVWDVVEAGWLVIVAAFTVYVVVAIVLDVH